MAKIKLIVFICTVLCINVVNSYESRATTEETHAESATRNNQFRTGGTIFGELGEFAFPDVPKTRGNGVNSILHLVDLLDNQFNKQEKIKPFHEKWQFGKHSKYEPTDSAKRKDHSVKESTSQQIKEGKDHYPGKKYEEQHPFVSKKNKVKDQRSFEVKEQPQEPGNVLSESDQILKKDPSKNDDINHDVRKSGSKSLDKTVLTQDHAMVDFVTAPIETETHTMPKNGSWLTSKKTKRNDLLDITRSSRLWLGVGVGACTCLVVVIVMSVIYLLLRSRRGRSCKLKEMSLDTSNDDKPIYIKLSQLHRPKRSPNYIVTVLDESHFSINSDDTSEEELFDLSAIQQMSPGKAYKNNLSGSHNVTSTPKKNNNCST